MPPGLARLPAEYLGKFTVRSRRELRAVSARLMLAAFGGALPADPDAVEQATAMYDDGIAYAGMLLGRLVEALRRRGTLDRTVVVVLSDHGEILGEHGEFGHGRSLYEPVLHVPLFVRYPPRCPRSASTPRCSTSRACRRSQRRRWSRSRPSATASRTRGRGSPSRAEFGSAAATDDPLLEKRARLRAYRSGRWQLQPGGTFFFDLDADPGEERDVSMKERLEVGKLREELLAWTERLGLPDLNARMGAGAPQVIDPAARERLRQLGYVE